MSHVASIELNVVDLDCLEKACADLGLVFKRNQQSYEWFGESVGDYPLPDGFKASDLGKCEHAIGFPDGTVGRYPNGKECVEKPYELGVVKRRDGKPGYTLLWDFFMGGYGLQDKIGENAGKLKQQYGAQVAIKQARKQGFSVQQKRLPNGKIQLVMSR